MSFLLLNLPDLVLMKILDFLPVYEYKKMSLIGQKFYELLQMHRYSQHIPLTIRFCWLNPNEEPWNFLIKSNRKFSSISLRAKCVKDLNKSEEFWRKIGQNTIKLSFTDVQKKDAEWILTNFIYLFPALTKMSCTDGDGLIFPEKLFEILPQTVEKLHLRYFFIDQDYNIQEKCKNLRFVTANKAGWHKKWDPNSEFFKLFRKFDFISVKPSLNLLNVKELNFGDINDIRIQFVEFHLSESIELFSKFSSLEILQIDFEEKPYIKNGCFFQHKIIKSETIKFFNIFFGGSLGCCQECCEFLGKSFPNIFSLYVKGEGTYNYLPLVQSVARNKRIRGLSYTCDSQEVNIKDLIFPSLVVLDLLGNLSFEGLSEPCLNISKLSIQSDQVELITKIFPNVTRATFYVDVFDEFNLKVMGKNWKNLRTLMYEIPDYYEPVEDKLRLGSKEIVKCIPTLRNFNETCHWMIEEDLNKT